MNTVRAWGWTAADREWQRDFATEADATAWAAAHDATITGLQPLDAIPPRDRAAEAAALTAELDAHFRAIRGR